MRAAAIVVGVMSLAESLWRRFMPKYLEALGAPVTGIGFFGTLEDFLDGTYQYPGGWLADHVGPRRALAAFVGLAGLGYLIYWWASQWMWIPVGLLFAMAWTSMASPALFSVIGDAPREQRAMGFTVQAIVKRLPILIAPTLGGLAIARLGVVPGVRALLLVSLALAALAYLISQRIQPGRTLGARGGSVAAVWASLPTALKRLLLSDIFIRTCEGMVDVFLVLFATNVIGLTTTQFGALLALQAVTSILVYVPVSRLSDRGRRKPFVTATFLLFAAFPVAVVLSKGLLGMAMAFVIGGLREIGEPSRKAMIVGSVPANLRGRSVGLYYLIRSLAISPAAFAGGILWTVHPTVPFLTAGAIGLIGAVLFAFSVEEHEAA